MNRLVSGLIVITVFVLAACGSGASSSSVGSAAPAAPSAAASSMASTAPSAGAAAGQTDTDWGRIWDTLPSDFPPIPGAHPSEEAAEGPASATLVVPGDVARQVATAMLTFLPSAGFQTEGPVAPLESGAYVVEATGPTTGCMLQVTVEPMGGETLVTILYGAACPHD